MRVLVLTVVHTPLDARIHRRQVRALLDAGHEVVYAAPFTGYGMTPEDADPRAITIDLPRAQQWRRVASSVAARRLLRAHVGQVDVAMLHDPELLLAAVGLIGRLPLVWDVHEDLAGSFGDKPWVPSVLQRGLAAGADAAERWAERRVHLLLAEEGYAARFSRPHPVVPNLPPLPARVRGPVDDRVVYVGRVSRLRGAHELVTAARSLHAHGIGVDIVGPVDEEVRPPLAAASDAGAVRLHGFLPNDDALAVADGALAGLSLLHDHPNYRHSLPTKVLEYQALGIPVVTTPLPAARQVVERAGSGVLVPFEGAGSVVDVVLALAGDRDRAQALGAAGRRDAEAGRSWDAVAPKFVRLVENVGGVRAR